MGTEPPGHSYIPHLLRLREEVRPTNSLVPDKCSGMSSERRSWPLSRRVIGFCVVEPSEDLLVGHLGWRDRADTEPGPCGLIAATGHRRGAKMVTIPGRWRLRFVGHGGSFLSRLHDVDPKRGLSLPPHQAQTPGIAPLQGIL